MSHENEAPRPANETDAVHGPHGAGTGAVSTPIVRSATFTFGSLEAMIEQQTAGTAGAFYQRRGHPTIHATEERLAHLEGAEAALLFPSGMAAISSAFLSVLGAGDHVVCVNPCYGGTQALLAWGEQRLGWSFTLVDAREPGSWREAFRPNTRLLHLESPINPTLTILDLAGAAHLGHELGAVVTCDNTIASPLGQRPLGLGADLSLYSATKSIGGHSDLLAGAVMGGAARVAEVARVREVFGPVPDPDTAWLIERSLKTLPLRVRAANANALELAGRLAGHPRVAQVFYPGLASHPNHALAARQMRNGFGPLLSFEVRGGADAALRVVNHLGLIRHGASLGGVESLASLAAWTSHKVIGPEGRRRAGIPEGLVRVSAGIENVEDLWADLDRALALAAAAATSR
ncbi:MAG: aminotransferase class I/II-fold pyridoxal phosphate-dependent enzyme [Candidatus Eisenbacteria bacterium]|nr:aminotransferase class I/II-fold pyridoxal phosphate-dependent enzyme [Candidatus Eisenbacteria bacterium]